jgi:hypothetical protein
MRRRSALTVVLLASLALVAAACGGGGSKSSSTDTSQSSGQASASDAQAVLAGIKTDIAQQGPQKVSFTLSATIHGSPKDPTLGVFLSKPISLTLSGPTDQTAQKSDLTFELSAGPIKVDGGLRQVGSAAFLQVNGKWYSLPAGSLSGTSSGSTGTTTSSSIDPSALLKSFGDPTKLLTGAKLEGTDDVDGIKSDHVTGNVDLAALVKGISSVTGSAGGSSASPVSPAEIASSVKSLQQYVQSATAGLWVGQSDKQIHKFETTINGVTDAATKSSSGIEGFDITIDASATPTSSPNVSAPSSPAPISQLQTDLGSVLGGLAAAGSTSSG